MTYKKLKLLIYAMLLFYLIVLETSWLVFANTPLIELAADFLISFAVGTAITEVSLNIFKKRSARLENLRNKFINLGNYIFVLNGEKDTARLLERFLSFSLKLADLEEGFIYLYNAPGRSETLRRTRGMDIDTNRVGLYLARLEGYEKIGITEVYGAKYIYSLMPGGDRFKMGMFLHLNDKKGFINEEDKNLIGSFCSYLAHLLYGRLADEELRLVNEKQRAQREDMAILDRYGSFGRHSATLLQELDTPLLSIMGASRMLKEEADLPSDFRGPLSEILQAASRLRGTLDHIKKLLPESTGSSSVFPLPALLFDLIGEFKRSNRNVLYLTDIENDLPVRGNLTGLTAAFRSFIGSAAATVEAAPVKEITVTAVRERTAAVISIADSGQGMPAATALKIFEPYRDNSETAGALGAACSLIREHGGDVFYNAGSRVIKLPLAVEPGEAPAKADAAKRILIVDDEEIITSFLKNSLEKKDLSVDCAGDSGAAAELLEKNSYDFYIIDVILDRGLLTGLDLYKNLIEKKRQAMGTLFMTGAVIDEILREKLRNTGCGIICKPFTLEELYRKIDEISAKPRV